MNFNRSIVVFGCKSTTQFLCESLLSITKIKSIITIDEVLAKKNKIADYLDLGDFSKSNNIEIYYAKSYSLLDIEDQQFCKNLKIDLAFVMGWQRLIPAEILNTITIGAFGMHGSSLDLPLGRGRSPMNWSIIEGRKVFYTNLFKYDYGIDSGDILATYKFSITEKDTAETMHFKNLLAMCSLIKDNFKALLNNSFVLSKQPSIKPTYYPKRNPENSLINWEDDIYNIERFIRAVSPPFNGAFTFCNGLKIIILDAQVFDVMDFGYEKEKTASIAEVFPNGKFLVKGLGGLLLINKYESENQIQKGDILDNNGLENISFEINAIRGFDI